MLGAVWMLAWLGVSAKWQQRSFWTAENLFATAFYGGPAIRDGFFRTTFSGLALYLLLYSSLGAIFAVAVNNRLPRTRTLLAAVLFGLVWYYLSFRWLWKSAIPLAFLLHSENATILGHLIYGTFLGRFQVYLEEPRTAAPSIPAGSAPDPAVETVAAPLLPETPDPDPATSPATPAPAQSSSPRDPA